MIYPETFSVIWTGEVQAAASEQYQLHTVSDDGVRLWLDVNQDGAFDESERVIDNFTFHGATRDSSAPIALQERSPQRFQLRRQGTGADKVLIKRLPVASPSQINRETLGGVPTLVSEIYVHR